MINYIVIHVPSSIYVIDIETSRVSPWIGLSISQTRTAKCCVPWCLSLLLGAELGLGGVDKGSISVHSRLI